ncbi:hypothetical protein CHH83_03390 [Bacillus sp. 7586-K]|nr:hypothetical protein CHH83_03390 [Bacillus sp. 7586-K]
MRAFLGKQQNGLYCRFLTVIIVSTNWNMKREDYLNIITETVGNIDEGKFFKPSSIFLFLSIRTNYA